MVKILHEWDCGVCEEDDGGEHKWRVKEIRDGADAVRILEYTMGDGGEWWNQGNRCWNCDAMESLIIENKMLRAALEKKE